MTRRQKRQLRKLLAILIAVLLIAAAAFLIANRVMPKSFSDLTPEGFAPTRCTIFHEDNVLISGEPLEQLLEALEQPEYYYNGGYGNVMVGNLYHIHFSNLSVVISDENLAYVGRSEYVLKGNMEELLNLLQTIAK